MLPALPEPVVLLSMDEAVPDRVTVFPLTRILPAFPLPVVAAVIDPPESWTEPVGPIPATLTVPPAPALLVLLLMVPPPESTT